MPKLHVPILASAVFWCCPCFRKGLAVICLKKKGRFADCFNSAFRWVASRCLSGGISGRRLAMPGASDGALSLKPWFFFGGGCSPRTRLIDSEKRRPRGMEQTTKLVSASVCPMDEFTGILWRKSTLSFLITCSSLPRESEGAPRRRLTTQGVTDLDHLGGNSPTSNWCFPLRATNPATPQI